MIDRKNKKFLREIIEREIFFGKFREIDLFREGAGMNEKTHFGRVSAVYHNIIRLCAGGIGQKDI